MLMFAPLLWQFTHGNDNNKSKVKMQIFCLQQLPDIAASCKVARQRQPLNRE